MAAELHRDDGRRGAHGKVEELDGVGSHHVGDAMMVDDLDDLGLLDAVGGLARLVVVHEHHLALRAHGHVRARDDADGEAVVVQHDGLAQRAGHEVFDSLLEQALLVEDEHIGLGDLVHLLTERGDEVAGDRHLVRPSVLEGVGGGDVALGDHARGDESTVGAVVVRHHERAHVVLAQQATRFEQRGLDAGRTIRDRTAVRTEVAWIPERGASMLDHLEAEGQAWNHVESQPWRLREGRGDGLLHPADRS